MGQLNKKLKVVLIAVYSFMS